MKGTCTLDSGNYSGSSFVEALNKGAAAFNSTSHAISARNWTQTSGYYPTLVTE